MKKTRYRCNRIGLQALNAFVLIVACLLAGQVRADGLAADCLRSGSGSSTPVYLFFNPAEILLPNNTQVGDPIGPWQTASDPMAWRCTPVSAHAGSSYRLSVQGYPPYIRDGFLSVDGESYGVYRTNDAALHYIARWRFSANGQESDWTPLTIALAGQQMPSMSFSMNDNNGQAFWLGVDVQIRFVKRSVSLTPGPVTIVDPMYVRHYQELDSGQTLAGGLTYRIAQVRPSTIFIVAGGTCTTPDQDVTLPVVSASSFTGIGSTAATTPFNLNFNNCPAGMSRIGYSFAPTTSVLDVANGVVALDGNPENAHGVGIQLTHDDNTPVMFGTVYPLEEYDTLVNRNYVVPMKASIYQTELEVTAGQVNSAVTFTLDYR